MKNALAYLINTFYTLRALEITYLMAKGKTVAYVMTGKQTKQIIGSGNATKDQIKKMNEKGMKKYSHSIQAREEVTIKPVKKGGTKALANAK
jgi:Holliday junction resolvasome RuvABC endonuclease subunit